MEFNTGYGLLLHEKDIKIHRKYFAEMTNLIGIKCIFYAPRPGKHWTTYGEIETNFYTPVVVGAIFNEHLDQKTMKKLGWVSELNEQVSAISVSYDLENLQVGAMFVVPSGIDGAEGRFFRVIEINNIAIYPASITCRLVPEYENTFSDDSYIHEETSMNLLNREDDDE